jgi:hypothetical protein
MSCESIKYETAADRAKRLGMKQIPERLNKYRPFSFEEYHGEPIKFGNGIRAVPHQWDEHGVWIMHHDSLVRSYDWHGLLAYECQYWNGKEWKIMGVLNGN